MLHYRSFPEGQTATYSTCSVRYIPHKQVNSSLQNLLDVDVILLACAFSVAHWRAVENVSVPVIVYDSNLHSWTSTWTRGEIYHGQRHRHTIFRNMGAATMTLSFAKDLAKSAPVLLVVQQKDALRKDEQLSPHRLKLVN